MKAFVTGINGFVGSYLAEGLINSGWSVAGTIFPGTGLENISQIKDQLELFPLDLTDKKSLDNAIFLITPDILFHLAGESSVKASFAAPHKTFNTNVMGSLNVLETIQNVAPKTRILLVSSGDVYGENLLSGKLVDEESRLIPCSPYGVSKAAVDMLGYLYAKSFNLDIVVARPFSHIGPRQTDSFFIPSLMRQIARIKQGRMERVIKLGNLDINRDFTDVRDVVAAYLLLAEKGERSQAYNICSGREYLLKDLVQMAISLSGEKIAVVQDPEKLRSGDFASMRPDNAKLRNKTGWRTTIDIKQSLTDVLDYWLRIDN